MPRLTASVGERGANKSDDVIYVQALLQRHGEWLSGKTPPAATGRMDAPTLAAIWAFQKEGASLVPPFQDGLIKPGSFTLARLELPVIARPKHRFFYGSCWFHNEPKFTPADYAAASAILGCDPAAVQSVAIVETKRATFDPAFGLPLILLERHKFSKHSHHRFDKDHPDIAHTHQTLKGQYGSTEAQPRRLWRAAMLDEPAALKSASWGMFQILGENHVAAGYATVEAFVDGMMTSPQKHLEAFVRFIGANTNLLASIRSQNWAKFAAGYNGPDYRDNDYDGKLARTFAAAKSRNEQAGAGH